MNFHNPTPGLDRQAFFFDFDGTLADIAPRPREVVLAPRCRDILLQLSQRTGGAVAVLSGRPRVELAKLIPAGICAAGLHGLEIDDAPAPSLQTPAELRAVRDHLTTIAARHPGALIEDKRQALALHWRLAPAAEAALMIAAQQAVSGLGEGWTLQPGKCVVEIRPRGRDKGDALKYLMGQAPFQGRCPIAFGDDLTDIPMLRAAQELGGTAVAIGERDLPCDLRLSGPTELAHWLNRRLASA